MRDTFLYLLLFNTIIKLTVILLHYFKILRFRKDFESKSIKNIFTTKILLTTDMYCFNLKLFTFFIRTTPIPISKIRSATTEIKNSVFHFLIFFRFKTIFFHSHNGICFRFTNFFLDNDSVI